MCRVIKSLFERYIVKYKGSVINIYILCKRSIDSIITINKCANSNFIIKVFSNYVVNHINNIGILIKYEQILLLSFMINLFVYTKRRTYVFKI